MEQALKHISAKGDLNLSYTKEKISVAKRITLDLDRVTVLEALQQAVIGTGLGLMVSSSGQIVLVDRPEPTRPEPERVRLQHQVSGTVTGQQDGAPLPGVNVVVKGTTIGTTTDVDGRYSLSAPSPNDTLVFSYIGFETQEVPIQGRSVIDVALSSDLLQLEGVVVTALGIEREKRSLGYAVQELEGEELEKVKSPNLLSTLTGKIAGLVVYNPTGLYETPQISLRGARPLIVVDGVPVDTDFWDISPDDIESINVLKGTTASALYGSRGKDGAIMITTKGSRQAQEDLAVSYNSSTMFQSGFIAIPEIQTQYGAGYGGQYAFVDGKGGGTFDGAGWIWGPRLDQTDPATGDCVKIAQYDSPIDPATGERIPTCWVSRGANNLEDFLQTGLITDHNLSVAQQGRNGYIRASLSHMYQRGQVPNTKLNRTSFALAGGYDFTRRLKADASWTYSRQYTPNYPRTGYGPHNYVYNLLLWMGPDVDVRDLKDYWQEGKEGIQQRHYNYAWYNNPYFLAYENLQGYYKDVNYGRIALEYNFSDDLKLTTRTGLNVFSLSEDMQVPLSLINYSDPTNGNYILESEEDFDINTDVLLDYRKQVHPDWEIKATLGGNARWYENRYLFSRTAGLNVPGLYNLTNSSGDVRSTNQLRQKRTNSLFGTFDLAFKDAIFLGVTGRNDWSSALPVQNNSYFYPSFALSTVLSDLISFPEFISFLKLRGSWAQVSSDLAIYSTIPVYSPAINWNSTPSVFFPGVQLNPDIQPETSTAREIGGEVRLLRSRLGLDVTYYNIIDENDITEFPVSIASGYSSRLLNANKYNRRGWEVILNMTPVRIPDTITWDLALNWSRHRRYLIELPEGVEGLNGVEPGERMDLFRGWRFNRSPDGQIIYEGGLPTWDPVFGEFGYDDPDWVAGLNSSLQYKNFNLQFQIDGRHGGLIYGLTHRQMWWGGTHPESVTPYRDDENNGEATYVGEGVIVVEGDVVRDEEGNIIEDTRVFAPNTTPVYWSSWVNGYYYATADEPNIFDESFIKLREVTLTYRLPQAWASTLFAEQASISLVGRNLWMWSKVKYIDPDAGVDNLQTPSARNLGFNVNLVF